MAIDQHLLMRIRHFDLIEVIEARPELLGIGLDEDTAIVVSGGSFQGTMSSSPFERVPEKKWPDQPDVS